MLTGCNARSYVARPCYGLGAVEDASDAELVLLAGSEGPQRVAAEAVLCRRFAPRIELYGMKHLRDRERARDLTQAVLVAVLQAVRAGRVDDPERLDRFVLGTCRNTVSRMRQHAARVPLASDEAIAALPVAAHETVPLLAFSNCLSKLESRASRILVMSFVEERSADEIAALLDTKPGNVRVIRHRALAAVRQCLDAAGSSRP